MLSKAGEIRRDEACLDYSGSDVVLYPCHGSKGNQVRFKYYMDIHAIGKALRTNRYVGIIYVLEAIYLVRRIWSVTSYNFT